MHLAPSQNGLAEHGVETVACGVRSHAPRAAALPAQLEPILKLDLIGVVGELPECDLLGSRYPPQRFHQTEAITQFTPCDSVLGLNEFLAGGASPPRSS